MAAAPTPNTNNPDSAVLPTSNRKIMVVRAEGPYVFDKEGKKYLDCASGIAVNSFGNCNAEIVDAVTKQMRELCHLSLTHNHPLMEEVSKTLADTFSPGAKVFWQNSGAEANECGIIAANSYHYLNGRPERDTLITFEGAFHGRTRTTRAATGKYVEGIGPLPGGFKIVNYNDLAAVEKAIDAKTSAILLEVVQGEGGIRVAEKAFLEGVRKLCDKHGILLYFDAVQCGIGRTAKMYSFEHYGVEPDIITLAKALGGGVMPVGACLLKKHVADGLTQNNKVLFTHGSTFGGGAPALAAVKTVLKLVNADNCIGKDAAERATYFMDGLKKLATKYPKYVVEARGLGFMLGLKLKPELPNMDMVLKLRGNGLFTMFAGDNTLRLLPPLTLPKAQIDEALGIMDKTFASLA